MHRKPLKKLIQWKHSQTRKPMIIRGARQVGKTWLMHEFGRTQYESVAYINLDSNTQIKRLFDLDFDVERIIDGLEIASDVKIKPEKTLIILDEIQEVPRALASLKYFYENAPEYHVVSAGSLLGVALHRGTTFPVGKVDFMDLYPLTFVEFLEATDNGNYAELIDRGLDGVDLVNTFIPNITDLLKKYYIVGGMPEVVSRYVEGGDFTEVRSLQETLIDAYEQDFSKYTAASSVPRLREVWDSIPLQLAQENKKFIFSRIKTGARAKVYEDALLWLEDAGMAKRVTRVSTVGHPLRSQENRTMFKLFFIDVGLLGAKSGIDPKVLLDESDIFSAFKGALAEQYVFQSLQSAKIETFYYAREDSRYEVDFVISTGGAIIPLEVKSGDNISSPALKAYMERFVPDVAIKTSLRPYSVNESGSIIKLPLVSMDALKLFIEKRQAQ